MTPYDILTQDREAYIKKQVHQVPEAPVISREDFLIREARGKVVLDIGASGPMHEAIVKVAKKCYGIDREDGEGVIGIDLDVVFGIYSSLPFFGNVELIICGEVLEHLSNPGWFLERLSARYARIRTIFTVPNAFSDVAYRKMEQGIENVNSDHVAWYSWKTIKTLLGRYGYEIKEFYWYKGRPRFSEGLIIVTE